MKITNKTRLFSGAVVALACTAALFGSASPASASVPDEIAGYTKAAFVEAAGAYDVPAEVAESAWGDLEAMATIPVDDEISAGVVSDVASLRTSAALASYSGSCWRSSTNAFGGVLGKLTVNKSWSTSGSGITSYNTTIQTVEGFDYAYNGLTISEDYYSTAYENARGKHTSNRQGRWEFSLGGGFNIYVRFDALALGGYNCS